MISTLCEPCIFAIKHDSKQTGCKFSRIEKFENAGVNIETVKEGDKTYYKIDRFCNLCRDRKWESNQITKGKNPTETALEEARIKLDFIVFFDKDNTLTDLEKSLKSISEQERKPEKIIVAADVNSTVRPIVATKLLKQYHHKWKYDICASENFEEKHRNSAKWSKGNYHSVVLAGKSIPDNFIESIDHHINEEMGRFIVAKNGDSKHLLTILNFAFDLFYKSPDLISEIAKENNQEYMIANIEDILYG